MDWYMSAAGSYWLVSEVKGNSAATLTAQLYLPASACGTRILPAEVLGCWSASWDVTALADAQW